MIPIAAPILRNTALALFLFGVTPLGAQTEHPLVPDLRGLVTLGSPAEDRLRLGQILGRDSAADFLLRSASTLSRGPDVDSTGFGWALLLPEVTTVWNSDLPFSLNDGSLWAGRGLNVTARAGARADFGRLSLIVAPEISYQENLEFQTLPFSRADNPLRSPFSSPWYGRPESLDQPMRFGSDSFTTVDLGQSSLSMALGRLTVGAASENLWWGPGIRNAILMSNQAPGIPHLFLRTSAPLSTPVGELSGRWILGRLRESDFFDSEPENDVRSLSAIGLVLRPAWEPDLALGFARAVYAPTVDGRVSPVAAFDVFRDTGRPNARPADDLRREPRPDQLFSLFGRWIFPRAGFETYAEWARYEQPISLRDLLIAPQHSQGYTLGLQWAKPFADSAVLRLQTEVTYLEPSAPVGQRRTTSWYTSRPVPQGYTHRGQVIGAGIGPGSSSQWLAADYLSGSGARVGVFGGRIRWDNAAFYQTVRAFYAHDTSVLFGLRAAYQLLGMEVAAEYSAEQRLNYLYQIELRDWDDFRAVDIHNRSLRLSVTPAWGGS